MNGDDRSLARSLRGPITLMTVGGLFVLNNFTPYRFDQTWPAILIVFGLLSLFCRRSRVTPPAGYPPGGGYAQGPWYPPNPQQPAPQAPPYADNAPAGTTKGGFGTSAPQRGGDASQAPGGAV